MSRAFRSSLFRWVAVSAAVLVLAACSDDGTGSSEGATPTDSSEPAAASADAYADAVCGAFSEWLTSIEEGGTSLQEDITGGTGNPEDAKQALVDLLDEILASTASLNEELDAVGPPDVDNGEELHQGMLAAVEQVRTVFQSARDAVAEIDASDPQALQQGLQEFATAMQEAEIENPIEGVESAELEEIFNENETCAGLDQMAA